MEKYRTQRRIIFLPFLLHVQPSTKVCLSKDRICGGSHECKMYTEFPTFTDNSLSCTVEPMFNISNSENHCYNLFFPIFNLFLQNWHRFPTCKNWKESTKTLNRKKSLAFCPACIVTVQANKQCRLSCLFSTVCMYIKICIHFHKRQNRKKQRKV